MGTGGSARLGAEIHEEVLVPAHAPFGSITIHLQHKRTPPGDIRVELVIPTAVQRAGEIEAFTVKA